MNQMQLNQYQQNEILTASSEKILLLLYDGAIRFTRHAILGVEKDDDKMRIYGVTKALAIITEFSNTLDREVGGKIAEDLDALYDYMIRELTVANIKKDAEKLLVVEDLLKGLRETWAEAIEINRKDVAARQQNISTGSSSISGYSAESAALPKNYAPLSVSS